MVEPGEALEFVRYCGSLRRERALLIFERERERSRQSGERGGISIDLCEREVIGLTMGERERQIEFWTSGSNSIKGEREMTILTKWEK